MITDPRMSTTTLGASMDVHVFPKGVVVPNCEECFFASELQILRLETDGSEGKEVVVLADHRRPFDDDVRIEAAALSNAHPIADPTVRPNCHILSNTGFRTDDGSGMN